jgi:CheY-like chemotaxis protein
MTLDRDAESRPLLPGHVLVAEDDHVSQFYVVELLKWIGCTCDVAASGARALAALESAHYDAVLLDCQLPELDGFAVAQQVRAWEATGKLEGHLPLIALTALDGDRDRCLAAGMDDYLCKPVLMPQLQTVLAKFLRR